MVRELGKKLQNDDVNYFEFRGLSTDDKPTNSIATGSEFFEIDTLKVFFFDESSGTWIEAGGS